MPKISIIVPVYNTEKYISNCIESILKQKEKDFELNYNLRFWFAKLNSWESIWDKYKCYQLRF